MKVGQELCAPLRPGSPQTLSLTRPFSQSTVYRMLEYALGGGDGVEPSRQFRELCLGDYSGLVNVCTSNPGRLFAKPADCRASTPEGAPWQG